MTTHTNLSDETWTLLGTGLSVCVVQPRGNALFFIGAAAPSATSRTGFEVESGVPTDLPQIAALGGGVWAKSLRAGGGVTYASA